MHPFSVIKNMDILKEALLQRFLVTDPVAVNPIRFQGLKERFCCRVVITVSLTAHALDHPVLG